MAARLAEQVAVKVSAQRVDLAVVPVVPVAAHAQREFAAFARRSPRSSSHRCGAKSNRSFARILGTGICWLWR